MSSVLLAIIIAVSSLFVGDIVGMNRMREVSAGSGGYKRVCSWKSCKINKTTYLAESSGKTVKKFIYNRVEEYGTYNIYSQKGTKKTLLVKDVEHACLTNGTYLYYVKYKNYRANVYRMALKTKKSKKVFTAPKKAAAYECGLSEMKGKYLYYITNYDNGALSYCTYMYNTKTQKNKKLGNNLNFDFWGNQLILQNGSTEVRNENIYFAKLDGTKKRKITSAAFYFIYNNKFYWVQQRYDEYIEQYQYRLGCCDKNGKGKKTLSIWKQDISIPYFDATKKEKQKCLKQFGVQSGCTYKESRKVYKDSAKTIRGVLSYEYPQFAGKSKGIKKVNANIRKQCKAFMNSSSAKRFVKSVKSAIKENTFGTAWEQYSYEVTCKVTYKKKNIVSICMPYSWTEGGVPGYGWKNLTYNTKTGKRLTYKDVISGNAKKKVLAACKKYYKDYPDNKEIIKAIKKKKTYQFYLENGKVYICFGRWEVTNIFAGSQKIPITAKYK